MHVYICKLKELMLHLYSVDVDMSHDTLLKETMLLTL